MFTFRENTFIKNISNKIIVKPTLKYWMRIIIIIIIILKEIKDLCGNLKKSYKK